MSRIEPGHDIPYPHPTSAAASTIGRANRRSDTKPELAIRRLLHAKGLRFRVDHAVRVGLPRAVKVDVAFTRVRLAVFVDGCFWHVCPQHGTTPKSNLDYWLPKLEANVQRDRRVDEALRTSGWTVLRCWEHEEPLRAAERIANTYERLK